MPVPPILGTSAGLLHDGLVIRLPADGRPYRGADVGDLGDRPGAGVLLTGAGALDAGRRLRRTDPDLPLLLDRRRYAGRRAASGRGGVPGRGSIPGRGGRDLDWIVAQRRLRVAAPLTDPEYIGPADRPALRRALTEARDAGPDVVAVLPLHPGWLRADLGALCDAVADHGAPVALALDRTARTDLYGLATVLALPVPVALLPGDGGAVGALGALAFGAAWVGVGVPWPHRLAAVGHDRPATALVDPLLSLATVDRIAAGWAACQDDPVWRCDCRVCAGRTLDRLVGEAPAEATAHTVGCLLDRRDELAGLPPGSLRRQFWQARCRAAELRIETLRLAGVPWRVPAEVRAWQRLWPPSTPPG